MTPLRQHLQTAVAWLDASRPPQVRPGGWRAFQLGLLFLPTSALLAGLGLFASLTLWRPVGEPRFLSRPLARWLLLLAAWLVVTMLAGGGSLEVKLRLANWLPFFWFLLAVRAYLASPASRERLGLMVIIATVPALVVGLLQAAFLWSGPWSGLWGLLLWDLPAGFAHQGAGVFPNPNFTAAFYGMVLPIAAAHSLLSRQRLAANGVLLLLALAIVITGSRTVLAGGALSVVVLAWRRFWAPLLALAGAVAALVAAALLLPPAHPLAVLAQRCSGDLPNKLIAMVHGAGSTAAAAVAAGRQPFRSELFAQAVAFVQHHPALGLAEPLVGLPAVAPPALMTHTHNVMFQLAIQHGLLAAVALVVLVAWLVVRAGLAVARGPLLDRSLVISAVMAVWLHAYDIPSFDSRNNLLGWLLLSCCWVLGGEARQRR